MKSFIYSFIVITLLVGCGYKPSSYHAKNAIVGNVYVDLKIDIDNARNSVLVKDAMNEMILNRFDTSLTNNKDDADTYVTVHLAGVSHKSLSKDDDGYVQSYRTTVNITMTYNKVNEKVKTITVSDYYDYSVEDDSIISDQKKKIAVKIASTKALSNIFSRIAVQNMKEVE